MGPENVISGFQQSGLITLWIINERIMSRAWLPTGQLHFCTHTSSVEG